MRRASLDSEDMVILLFVGLFVVVCVLSFWFFLLGCWGERGRKGNWGKEEERY